MTAIDRLRGLSDDVAIKYPCLVATTANITLNGLQTIDGVTVVAGDRVLVKNQTSGVNNGIYVADTSDWERDVDFSGPGDLAQGTLVLVVSGTVNGSTVFQLTTASPVIGTTSLTFAVTGAAALALASAFWLATLPLTTASASLAALGGLATSILTTRGDIIVRGASAAARLALGTSVQYLGSNGTDVVWVTPPGSFTVVRNQTFSGSGTYTPHASMLYCVIEVVGAGGGGGGVSSASVNVGIGAGGGGGGSYSRLIASAATIGASKTVTIGAAGAAGASGANAGSAGGDTSVGTICIGKGGSGGGGAATNGTSIGGAGGVAGTGNLTATGAAGLGVASTGATSTNLGGAGGSSAWGSGAVAVNSGTAATGAAGTGYGGGGGGGQSFNAGGAAAGGAGTAGYVIVTEYCSA